MKLSLVISAQATRYGGVELVVRDPLAMDAAELDAMLARHSLVCPVISTGQAWIEERLSFTSPDPKVREAAVERIRQHIALAARMNTMVMLGLIRGKRTEGISDAQAMAWLVEALRECASVS